MNNSTCAALPVIYSAMHEQEGTIQPFAAATCPFLDILLQGGPVVGLLVRAF